MSDIRKKNTLEFGASRGLKLLKFEDFGTIFEFVPD